MGTAAPPTFLAANENRLRSQSGQRHDSIAAREEPVGTRWPGARCNSCNSSSAFVATILRPTCSVPVLSLTHLPSSTAIGMPAMSNQDVTFARAPSGANSAVPCRRNGSGRTSERWAWKQAPAPRMWHCPRSALVPSMLTMLATLLRRTHRRVVEGAHDIKAVEAVGAEVDGCSTQSSRVVTLHTALKAYQWQQAYTVQQWWAITAPCESTT